MNTFSGRAVTGIMKLGRIYCPKSSEFPGYAEVADKKQFDRLVEQVPSDDFSALNLVLAIFSFLPEFILRWLAGVMERAMDNPSDGLVASSLRQLNLGIRGLVYSTYYSELTNAEFREKTPLNILEYEINRVVD